MSDLNRLAEAMQSLLTTEADDLARQTGFVVRRRKVTGANFALWIVASLVVGAALALLWR